MVEDPGEAFDFVWHVCVECVLGGGVLLEEAILGGLEYPRRVIPQGAVCPPDCGDCAVANVGHGVVEVACGFVGVFMSRISLVFLADALSSVDVPLLQVCPDFGDLRSAVVYGAADLRGVGAEEGPQLLLCMPEGMEHISQGCGSLVIPILVLLLGAAGDSGRAHGSE